MVVYLIHSDSFPSLLDIWPSILSAITLSVGLLTWINQTIKNNCYSVDLAEFKIVNNIKFSVVVTCHTTLNTEI